MNKEIVNAIKSTKTVDELKEVAAKKGYVLTDEEANGYFATFHTDGKVNEEQLDNVAGGTYCRNARTYSDDSPYYLITTLVNGCSLFEHPTKPDYQGHECSKCKYLERSGPTCYCKRRKFNDDPLNPAK